ncbi:hypothetical protein H0H93_012639 [Arthromyces matolae]|nr:hypothetical protein H0H93_012639 [Arthromyces matolae]
MADATHPTTNLTWANIALSFTFVLFDVGVSAFFGLGVEQGLLTAAIRCVAQLAVMAVLLHSVFSTNNPYAVAGIALLLNLLGTFEIVANKAKRRHHHMFPLLFIGMLSSTLPISIIGSRWAMSNSPFWSPANYIPVVGMLCGNAISAIVITVNFVMKELHENRDKVETYLAYGASRLEACKPIAREALRMALTPVINQMSVIGMISIPGMMTGALLGGASVDQAAYLQIIIMFMISSATALASFFATISVIIVTVDSEHRVRPDRINDKAFALWRARSWVLKQIVSMVEDLYAKMKNKKGAHARGLGDTGSEGEEEEREMLITASTPISPFAPRR